MPGENGKQGRLSSFRIQDNEAYKTFKTWLQDQDITLEDFFNGIINKKASEFDGMKHGLDKFTPANYVPKPDFDGSFESKVNWLKIQPDETIEKILDDSYKIRVMCHALLETDPKQRGVVMPYLEAWQRYGKR